MTTLRTNPAAISRWSPTLPGTLGAWALAVLAAAWLSAGASPSGASAPPEPSGWDELPRLCDDAAVRASAATGVPLGVLRAIALTETGRTLQGAFRPWPWTVNVQGEGKWFDSQEAARNHVADHHRRGARSFDVGCFQINYRWHGQHFTSVDQMFDPDANAAYAARLLAQLHAELGDWSRAAGAYHSRTPSFAQRYRERFDSILARLPADGPVTAAAPAASEGPATGARTEIRDNRFPLLVATGADRGLASLVPMEIVASDRFIDSTSRSMMWD